MYTFNYIYLYILYIYTCIYIYYTGLRFENFFCCHGFLAEFK